MNTLRIGGLWYIRSDCLLSCGASSATTATTDRFVFRVISIRLHFCMDHKLEMSENGMKIKKNRKPKEIGKSNRINALNVVLIGRESSKLIPPNQHHANGTGCSICIRKSLMSNQHQTNVPRNSTQIHFYRMVLTMRTRLRRKHNFSSVLANFVEVWRESVIVNVQCSPSNRYEELLDDQTLKAQKRLLWAQTKCW